MAAADMYVTQAGAGLTDGTDWDNAFAETDFVADLEANAEAGDRYFIRGNLTLSEAYDASLRDGTGALPIWLIGVKAGTTNTPPVFSDYPTGADRPTIACAANATLFGDYYIHQNLDITTTSTNGWNLGFFNILHNDKANNSGAATRAAVTETQRSKIIGCELQCVNGRCLNSANITTIVSTFIHTATAASGVGIRMASNDLFMCNSVIKECDTGIDINDRDNVVFVNNVIYGCDIMGVSGTTGEAGLFLNNIIDACAVGVDWTTVSKINWFDYNCWNNTVDIADADVVKGDSSVTGAPGMADPANDDFTVTQADANVHDKALDVGDLTGATV